MDPQNQPQRLLEPRQLPAGLQPAGHQPLVPDQCQKRRRHHHRRHHKRHREQRTQQATPRKGKAPQKRRQRQSDQHGQRCRKQRLPGCKPEQTPDPRRIQRRNSLQRIGRAEADTQKRHQWIQIKAPQKQNRQHVQRCQPPPFHPPHRAQRAIRSTQACTQRSRWASIAAGSTTTGSGGLWANCTNSSGNTAFGLAG